MFFQLRFILVVFFISHISLPLMAEDEFSFDLTSYEKKAYEFGGYTELILDRQWLAQDSAAYQLSSFSTAQRTILDHQLATVELTGQYHKSHWQVFLNAHAIAEHDNVNSSEDIKIYEGLVAYKPEPGFTLELGKKSLKWGKGYAWNPVGFVERPKNPEDPDDSREGYNMVTMDFIKSYSGKLKTVAFTPVYLPVTSELNNDFGRLNYDNVAAKLYFLYNDIDIDFTFLSEGSRSYRYGIDFAHNITTNFEVHGEWAYLSDVTKRIIDQTGTVTAEQIAAAQWLLGLRYLTENDTTIIAEYYKNEAGYSAEEMTDFFTATDSAYEAANTILLNQLSLISQQTYLKRNPGKQYLYLRLSNKEPFDWLYLTPAITVITNLDDQSYSITPELIYTAIKNLELRLKASWLSQKKNTEFGEKRSEQKLEFRLRYYF
ncbi:MAG: hypothetical protein OQK75_01345 [Gammaproteobacteria bacterium]|nr:hypothetical protein [Gammaproteobacteria bacterium]MCW8986291.1 hypothetical protein [Gammaproteobacteria bacterium]MCW9030241.1 hypothetical protein [Gammaproteobacteria bacterium]